MQKNNDYDRFFSELNIKNDLKIEEDLGSGFVKLKISEAERRQALQDIKTVEEIVVEFLRNSRDSFSKNIFIATKKTSDKKRLIYCIDDGGGIPEKFHNLIFQSRVTSKLEDGVKDPYGFHGRGMALFSIKLNVEDVAITFSDLNRGTCIYTEIDLNKISEKKDQSIYPNVIKNGNDLSLSGGVNNIAKILLEFVLENPSVNLYYGSPTQIICTMINIYKKAGMQKTTLQKATMQKNPDHAEKFESIDILDPFISSNSIPVTGIPFFASTPTFLGELLKFYYRMDISERGLQRIFYDEIKPLSSLNDHILYSVDPLQEKENFRSINSGMFKNSTGSEKNPGNAKKNAGKSEDLHGDYSKVKMHDELRLANRFKDEEISYIIDILKNEITRIGSKHLLSVDNDIIYKKAENTISIIINLKQTD